jgi:hypothetical protein
MPGPGTCPNWSGTTEQSFGFDAAVFGDPMHHTGEVRIQTARRFAALPDRAAGQRMLQSRP